MGWQDLLQKPNEAVTLPWVGGRELRYGARAWRIQGRQPVEHGWYRFKTDARKATLDGPADPCHDILGFAMLGYLVGDRLVPDGVWVDPNPVTVVNFSEPVYLLDEGLDRFVRVKAARHFQFGPLIFVGQELPFGPEDAVLAAYLDEKSSVNDIRDVPPALDAAFRMESWQRAEVRRRRAEEEQLRREEEERLAREQRTQALVERLGDAAGRRAMAVEDFGGAATAALAVGGATYLDHRLAARDEMAVRFRFMNRRFECTCNARTLRIIDAGICLQDHDTGERGDRFFTLESLPAVLMQAANEGKLVVLRHV